MGDYEYMRNMMNLSPEDEPDMVDILLEREARAERVEAEQTQLAAGRVIHLIWLTPDIPARFVRGVFNLQLPGDMLFAGYNHLRDESPDSPGSWFVANGLEVRSKRVDGLWLQCVFGSSRPSEMFNHEIVEYLQQVAKVDVTESMLPEDGSIVVSAANGYEGPYPGANG